MKRIFAIISALALVGTVLPSVLYLAGQTSLPTVKMIMLVCTVVWFVATPLWMEHTVGE